MQEIILRNLASIFIRREGQMLLLYRQGSRVVGDAWVSSAGGHLEPAELNAPQTAVLRELMEELGLAADQLRDLRLRYITLKRKGAEVRQHYYYFAELLPGAEPQPSSEGISCWVPLEEIVAKNMPFTSQKVAEHWLAEGQYTEHLYGAVGDGENLVFTVMQPGE